MDTGKRAKRRQYKQYLASPEWQAKRAAVIYRDRGRCCRCGSRWKLEVHHRTYIRFGRERLSDLVTLCEPCHEAVHAAMNYQRARALRPRLTPAELRT